VKTLLLFVLTAVAEIVGCYLPYLWLRQNASVWLLLPAALSLGLFAWLLTLHPTAAGRVYAAYGGVYIAVALLRWDLLGVALCMLGMVVIMFSPRTS
jgi:small multidrug resistance family-3 protein